jgi:flavin prenyltransferase
MNLPSSPVQTDSLPVIVAITGASGSIYGIRILELLKQVGIPTHCILSPSAEKTIQQETEYTIERVRNLASVNHSYNRIEASIASGSCQTRGMVIAPCSIKTLSGVANSYSDNLVVRAADVCLKEGRPLLLVVRETPLHAGHLRLMQEAAQTGAIIFPPVPAFYHHPSTIDEIITDTASRILQRIGISTPAKRSWQGLD